MKKVMSCFLLALFCIAGPHAEDRACAQEMEQPAAPSISFEKAEWDFGAIHIDEGVGTSFRFSNTGTSDLVIEKIDSSCGCVVAEDVARSYGPGESGELRVQFDPNEAGTTGRVKKDVVVYSNDPAKRRSIISLTAFVYTVDNGVPHEPSALDFGDVTVETETTKSIKIYEDYSRELLVVDVEAFDGFDYSIEAGDGPQEAKWIVRISNKPNREIGPVSGLIKVHTSNKVQPVLEIPISLNVIGQIEVEPLRLFFGHFKQGEGPEKAIRLSSSNNQFAVLGAICDLSFVDINIGSEVGGKSHKLTARIIGDVPVGRFMGEITIKTDNRYQPEIKVPVIGRVSEPAD